MARNKHPEETVKRIVNTATKLFMENGYDNTSIQDILNALGNLSKGAIYHHFRSKEDILDAVTDFIYEDNTRCLFAIAKDKKLTGLEKLRQFLECSIGDIALSQIFSLSIDMMKNPRLLAIQLQNTIEMSAKTLILPVILEGVADGSLRGLQHPTEFAEVFMLLINIWANPMIFSCNLDAFEGKFRFIQTMIHALGVEDELISEDMIVRMRALFLLYEQRKTAIPTLS